MKEDIEKVKKYYDDGPQTEWDRLDQHPFEFILTTYMMDKYIRPGDRVLDIGGGPGRYSVYYAQKGCEVTLVDLSEGNIEFAKKMAQEKQVPLRAVAKNCLELAQLDLGEYDHVFLMGPLYHLGEEKERELAVRLALEKLKAGGNLYCSFIMNFAGIIFDMKNGPGFLEEDLKNEFFGKVLDSIVTGTEYAGPAFAPVCFISPRQIVPFMSRFALDQLHLFGQEGILSPNENQILGFPQAEIDLWVETAKKFLEIPELLTYSEHAMYIGRKR